MAAILQVIRAHANDSIICLAAVLHINGTMPTEVGNGVIITLVVYTFQHMCKMCMAQVLSRQAGLAAPEHHSK